MPLTQTQLHNLRLEFQNDPRGYGYAAVFNSGQDNASAIIIDTIRDGTNPPSTPTGAGGNANGSIKVNNVTVDTGAVRAATLKAAYDGLVSGDRAWFNWLTTSGLLAVSTDLLQQLAGIPTPSGSVWATGDRAAMNAAMAALLQKFASRSEELFGVGVQVTADDVHNCRTA